MEPDGELRAWENYSIFLLNWVSPLGIHRQHLNSKEP